MMARAEKRHKSQRRRKPRLCGGQYKSGREERQAAGENGSSAVVDVS
jgi:hypothetical protein